MGIAPQTIDFARVSRRIWTLKELGRIFGLPGSLPSKLRKTKPVPRLPVRSFRTRGLIGDAPSPGTQLKFHYAPHALNSMQKGSRSLAGEGDPGTKCGSWPCGSLWEALGIRVVIASRPVKAVKARA